MSAANPNEVLIAAKPNENDANHEMESLRHRMDALIDEKNSMEADFGYKRAKFKEIMLKKEGKAARFVSIAWRIFCALPLVHGPSDIARTPFLREKPSFRRKPLDSRSVRYEIQMNFSFRSTGACFADGYKLEQSIQK